jgi:hypothetical protein
MHSRPAREPNLFVYFHDRLRRNDDDQEAHRPESPGGWENALTEATAFYLSCDRDALATVVRSIDGQEDPPTRIGTQLRGVDGVPDLAIERKSGKRLIIECKVDADLGDRQLERYLESLSPDHGHLALLSRRRQRVPEPVAECALYIKPKHGGAHFSWEDLHSWLLAPDAGPHTALRGHFLRYLERLGFERLAPEAERLIGPRSDPKNRRQQENFGRRLAGTKRWLELQGHKVNDVSRKGLQAAPRSRAPYLHLVVWPAASRTAYVTAPLARLIPGAALVVGVVFERGQSPRAETVFAALPRSFTDDDRRHWVTVPPRRIGQQRIRLEVACSLDSFLGKADTLAEQLERGVAAVVRRIQPIMTSTAAQPNRTP